MRAQTTLSTEHAALLEVRDVTPIWGFSLWLGTFDAATLPAFSKVYLLAPEVAAPDDARVIRVSMSDRSPWSDVDFVTAEVVAQKVYEDLAAGLRVLACCREGLNRSAIVVGLTCHRIFPEMTGRQHLEYLRARRGPRVLYNQQLADYLAAK